MRAADGKRGIWSLEKSEFRPIPGLESNDYVIGWTQDGESVYVAPLKRGAKAVQVYRANIQTGKMEPWKSFGAGWGRRARRWWRLICRATGVRMRISTCGLCRKRTW